MQSRIQPLTPEQLWQAHRGLLGGKSAVTGAPLPASLAECQPGVQASHYGLALIAARHYRQPDPPAPPGLSKEDVGAVLAKVANDGSIIPNEPPPPPPPSVQ